MKKINNPVQIIFTPAIFALLILFGAVTAATAQIYPFVDCVEPVRDANGAATDNYTAYFGYISLDSTSGVIPTNTLLNNFTPVRNPPYAPNTFQPGVHQRVVAVVVPNGLTETWRLNGNSVTASFGDQQAQRCSESGTNFQITTYQGKLSDGAAAANGVYDLQFQLFNAVTGGAARTTLITVEDVQVTNGIFTVQLNLGAAAIVENIAVPNLKFNPAILDGGNSFFEIGVRAGTSTGAFTILAPRQSLTAVPLAVRAQTAATAFRAVNADNATNATNATNSAQLGGAAANQFVQTNDSRLSDARTPTAGSPNYIQNTTTQQANSSFNISGGGTLGGTLTADSVTANGVRARGGAPGGFGVNNNGYTFSGNNGDDDSGLFSNGNGLVSLYTNATERIRITDSGLQVFGTLTANTKNFKIDHPLDPLNKTLTYTSVESPDMMNIYNGNITTNANGEAVVTMPDYFEALNKDFRYQLTVIGTFAQAIVLEKIKGNTFKIKTDKPNVEVSWQVTGIRHDKFAEDKQIQVEQEKSAADKGKCLYAPACRNNP